MHTHLHILIREKYWKVENNTVQWLGLGWVLLTPSHKRGATEPIMIMIVIVIITMILILKAHRTSLWPSPRLPAA